MNNNIVIAVGAFVIWYVLSRMPADARKRLSRNVAPLDFILEFVAKVVWILYGGALIVTAIASSGILDEAINSICMAFIGILFLGIALMRA